MAMGALNQPSAGEIERRRAVWALTGLGWVFACLALGAFGEFLRGIYNFNGFSNRAENLEYEIELFLRVYRQWDWAGLSNAVAGWGGKPHLDTVVDRRGGFRRCFRGVFGGERIWLPSAMGGKTGSGCLRLRNRSVAGDAICVVLASLHPEQVQSTVFLDMDQSLLVGFVCTMPVSRRVGSLRDGPHEALAKRPASRIVI